MNGATSRVTRALVTTGIALIEFLLQRVYHLLIPFSPGSFVVWDALHVFLGVVVLPIGLALLLVRWGKERPIRAWSIVDVLLLVYGIAVLTLVTSEVGYWIQETLLPLPSSVSHALMKQSVGWTAPLLLLLLSAAVHLAWNRIARNPTSPSG